MLLWDSFENYFKKWKTQCTQVMVINKGMFFSSVFSHFFIFFTKLFSLKVFLVAQNLLWPFAIFHIRVSQTQWYFLFFNLWKVIVCEKVKQTKEDRLNVTEKEGGRKRQNMFQWAQETIPEGHLSLLSNIIILPGGLPPAPFFFCFEILF